jgi:hypothetical protein
MNKKEVINHALKSLGYYEHYNGEFSSPKLSIDAKINLLYAYLGLTIKESGYVVVKRLPTRAKKEKK